MTFLTNNSPLENRYFSLSFFSVNNGLWAWGNNNFGQLGINNQTNYSSPITVGAESYWTQVSCGYKYTLSIQNNGTLWAWGDDGGYGALGLNTTTTYSSPVQVGTLSLWESIFCKAGGSSTFAIQNNGTLWAWGDNNYGQLGLGDTINRSSPTQVGDLNTWTTVANGSNYTLAIQNNGTLWGWGLNNFGQLGNNSNSTQSSPVQIGTLSIWASVSAEGSAALTGSSLAIQSNGTLWSWGRNASGQLGLNTNSTYSSPVQVGTLSDWAQVLVYNNVIARKTNGTLWAWGANSQGQLGLNTTVGVSSPVQVGSLSSWAQISNSFNTSCGIQNNGTLWAWGNNNFGQLGIDTTTNYSSPVQVGTLNNWNFVACGDTFVTATQKP